MGQPRGGRAGPPKGGRRGSTRTAERQSRCAHLGQRRNGAGVMQTPGRSPLTKLLTFRHPVARSFLSSYWPPEKRWLFARGGEDGTRGRGRGRKGRRRERTGHRSLLRPLTRPVHLALSLSPSSFPFLYFCLPPFSALTSGNCSISISGSVFPFIIRVAPLWYRDDFFFLSIFDECNSIIEKVLGLLFM